MRVANIDRYVVCVLVIGMNDLLQHNLLVFKA